MPSINSARYAQRIIQTESHESPSFLRKVHRLDPPPGQTSDSAEPTVQALTGRLRGTVAERSRALDWRPGGPGFESRCDNFASELLVQSIYAV